LTKEGYVYFNKGHYIYTRRNGYAIKFRHGKNVATPKNLQELEDYLAKVASELPVESEKKPAGKKPTSVKKVTTSSAPAGVTLWKNDTKKPTDHEPTKEDNWKGQKQIAQELEISNWKLFGRKQLGYIIYIADPERAKEVNAKKGDNDYCANKLSEMGVIIGAPKSTPSPEVELTARIKKLEATIAKLTVTSNN
jgi:hypothetical protein